MKGVHFRYRVPPQVNLTSTTDEHYDLSSAKNAVRKVLAFLEGKGDYGANNEAVKAGQKAIIGLLNFDPRPADEASTSSAARGAEEEDTKPGEELLGPVRILMGLCAETFNKGKAFKFKALDLTQSFENVKTLAPSVFKLTVKPNEVNTYYPL